MDQWPYNYHCHTPYGDGHSAAREYAEEGARRGMRTIGISEHAPLGQDVDWTLAPDAVDRYRAEVRELQAEFAPRLEVLCGLESDWWPARAEWWEPVKPEQWDYLIGSVHYLTVDGRTMSVDDTPERFEQGVAEVFGGDIRAACEAFFKAEAAAASSGRFHVLGHLDLVKKFNHHHRYFNPDEGWYRTMAFEAVDAAAESRVIVEVNTAGLDKPVAEFYPAPWLLERAAARGVRITLNSDAHAAHEIQRHFPRVLGELRQLGVRELWRLSDGEWRAEAI